MIKMLQGYPYDNKYDYSKSFNTKIEQTNYFNTFTSIIDNEYNEDDEQGYIKENSSFNVNHNYDYLVSVGVNYIIFDNGYKEIFAFITSKEYLSEDITRLNYEVDVIQTFMFDFTIGNSFIERKVCSIAEIADFDEGLNIGEHSLTSESVAFIKGAKYFAMFSGIKNFEVTMTVEGNITHYAEIPSSNAKPSTIIDGVNYPLFFMPLTGDVIPSLLSDHPSLVGIVRFPNCTFTTQQIKIPYLMKTDDIGLGKPVYMTVDYLSDVCVTISSSPNSGSGGNVLKNEIVDFFPYTYYILTDGECEPLIMKPQYLPTWIVVEGRYALSHQPIERFYVNNYKGDTLGKIYNITNTNQMMLPTATSQGMSYISANGGSLKMQRDNAVIGNVLNGVATVGAAIATSGMSLAMGGVQSTVGGINQIRESDQRSQDMMLTPSSISSYGTPSTRNAFETNNVRVLKYSVSDLVKTKIRNFNLRFANKYNNYAIINHKSYKGYIKFIAPNIDSKIDNLYINSIISILERGVYFE